MNEQDQIFMPIIWTHITQYKLAVNSHVKKKVKEALKDSIKKWTDQPVSMVSESVMNHCQSIGVNPFELMWPNRLILGKDNRNRSMLLWEHTTPIGELFEILIKCQTIEEVSHIMNNYSGVCWIMRSEDDALNANGFKTKRPNGWLDAYSKCGIKVLNKVF